MPTRANLILLCCAIMLSGWSPSIIYAQTPTFDICVRDFNDLNQNGQWDEGEQSFPGLAVMLLQNGTVVGALTTSPDEDCIRSLTPGDYQLSIEASPAYQLTTAAQVNVPLVDQSLTIDLGAIVPTAPATPRNEICVVIYQDGGQAGAREEGENPVGGIDVNLLTADVIVQTLITSADGPSCFANLPVGRFQIIVPPSPNHLLTTRNDAAVDFVDTGNRITANFGAQTIDPLADGLTRSSINETDGELTFDEDTRRLLAMMGAAVAMLFMVGVGAIVMGLMRRK